MAPTSCILLDCHGHGFRKHHKPHLIKRLVSVLRNHTAIYIGQRVIVNFQDFKDTWEFDRCIASSQLLPHITEAHFHPNSFQVMNVKRAFQILSQKFANAIRIAGNDPNGLKSQTWETSADFAQRMNSVIDALNVYRLTSKNSRKQPLSSKHPETEILLNDFVEWSAQWSLISVSDPERQKLKRVPCMNGLTMSVRAILNTYHALQNEYEDFELATALCNQDSVEHLFSKLRQRGGHNPNPTSRMVRLSLRHILSTGYIHTSDKANVVCEKAYSLITEATEVSKAFETSNESTDAECERPYQCMFEEEEPAEENYIRSDITLIDKLSQYELNNDEEVVNYERNAITYLAGYVARKNRVKNGCDECRQVMMKTPMECSNTNEMFIELQEYANEDEDAPTVSKLIRPTAHFAEIVSIQLNTFASSYKEHWKSIGLVKNIAKECIIACNAIKPEWFDEKDPCYTHRVQTLEILITVKIFAQTRRNNALAKKKMSERPAYTRKMKKVTSG